MARRDFPEVPGYLKPTIGSTEVASGATVSTVEGLTLSNPTLTGTLTAGAAVGTNGQVLQSTGTGVQWATPTSGEAPFSTSSIPNFYGVWQNFNDATSINAVSDNGTDWSPITAGYSSSFTSTAYGFGRFFAITGSDLYRSIDGYNWDLVTTFSSTVSNLYFVNNVMFAVDDVNETNTIFYSADGVTWSARSTPGNPSIGRWFKPSFGNGTYFMGRWNNNVSARSTDGLTWVTSTLPNFRNWNESAFGNGRFVVAGGSRIAYSTDAITWTEVSLAGISSSLPHTVEFVNGKFVVAPQNGQTVVTSSDGITWEYASSRNGYYSKLLFASGFAYDGSDDSNYLFYSNKPGLNTWIQSKNPLYPYKPVSIAAAAQYSEISPVITATTLNASITRYSHIIINTSSTHTITLPTATAYNRGKELHIKQIGSATVVSASSNVRPIGSNTAGTAILSGVGKFARLVSDGFSWTIMDSN